jgi:hypothetical protein
MRKIASIILAASVITTAALAAETSGPLAPGKPAGVKQAEMGTTGWALLGIGVVAAIAIGVASGSNGSPTQPQNNLANATTTV